MVTAAEQLGRKLEALYETLPEDERAVLDFILRQAAEHVAGQADTRGYGLQAAAGAQDAMKNVLFGAAGVTGGLATPGVINWLVASARDANLFS